MKGLFENCSDDCTYSYQNLIFVFEDELLATERFIQKLEELYPTITENDLLTLIIEEEEIKVKDCNGYTTVVQIQNVLTFE